MGFNKEGIERTGAGKRDLFFECYLILCRPEWLQVGSRGKVGSVLFFEEGVVLRANICRGVWGCLKIWYSF